MPKPKPVFNDPDLLNLGQRINDQRKYAGLTQEELGDRVDLSRSSVANIECGRQNPSYLQLLAIARALHVGVGVLAGDPPPSRRKKTIK